MSISLSHFYIGEMNLLMGELESGLQEMEQAFTLDNMNFDIQTGLLQAYLLTNKLDEFSKLERSLSKLNRKFVVPDRVHALVNYLVISEALTQDKKAKREQKELSRLFEEGVIIDQWIYAPYLDWLSKCSCEESVKKELTSLTNEMKSQNLD